MVNKHARMNIMRGKVQHGEVTEYRPSLIIKPSTLNTWFVLHHYRVLFQISNQLLKKNSGKFKLKDRVQ